MSKLPSLFIALGLTLPLAVSYAGEVKSIKDSHTSKGAVVEMTSGSTTDKANNSVLSPLNAPFKHPFQYVGMPITKAAKVTDGIPNKVGNIIINSERAEMLLEADGNSISYVDVELMQTAPCSLTKAFDSKTVLNLLSINPAELEQVGEQRHFHTYSDHKRKLKVSVSCQHDGAPLSVGFSSKYYGK